MAESARVAAPGGVAPTRDSILGAVEVIGDAWSWLILREAVLHQLEMVGVLARNASAPRLYALTPAGEDFFGCLMVAQRWGDTWRPRQGAVLSVTHRGFGHTVSALLRCQRCGEPVHARDVTAHRETAPNPAPPTDMRRRTPDMELLERVRPCSISHTLTVTGEWWSSLIVREMFFGVRRFDELQRRLGIGPNVLSTRLRHLMGLGVVRKVEYQTWPVRHEYRLTDKGMDYYPVPLALAIWGRRWLPPAEHEPRLTHKCGREVRARLCCEECGREITRADVDIAAPV